MKVLVSPEFVLVFFLISSLALGPLPTQAALRYVDPDHGSDVRGDATKENPVKTIDRAFDFAKTGDTLYLESGTFDSIVLPKALGIWGNSQDKPTIDGPISFGSQVTALVDLYYRDLVLTGSQGFVFDKSIAVDGVSFERLEMQLSPSGVFIGGQGQLNVSGDGLLFDNLKITQSGSGSAEAVSVSVSSGPVYFMNMTVTGNNYGLIFNVSNSPKNIQITNITFSNNVQFSVSNPASLLVSHCTFSRSGLNLIGGSGTIQLNTFSQSTTGPVINIESPTVATKGFEYQITNNTFSSYKGVDLTLVDESSPLEVVFQDNYFINANSKVIGLSFQVNTITVDAKNNWWGSDSGPQDLFCNQDGQGASIKTPSSEISANVLYRPWCGTSSCSVLKTVRSACAAGDDPAGFIADDADPMTPWGMSILIISVCSVSYLVFLMIFYFAFQLRKKSATQHAAPDQEKST